VVATGVAQRAAGARGTMHDDLDLADLIDGFPIDAPWVASGAVWFDDLDVDDRHALHRLFESAATIGTWPAAPDVQRPDDPRLVAWVAATLHVVSRLRQETLAFAEQLIRPALDHPRRGFITIPDALDASIELIELAREPIDTDLACIEMAMELNELTITLADTGHFPPPPRSLARYVDLTGCHWANASYRHHRGRDFYCRLDLELAHVRADAGATDPATPWDLHAWVFALVTLWTGAAASAPTV
jgi:hypothetical protein